MKADSVLGGIDPIRLTHSFADAYTGCSRPLAIVNEATRSLGVPRNGFNTPLLLFLDTHPEGALLDHMITLGLVF